jgi:RNA polymerase sigma-70 factor (ECF subfamily)
MDGPATTNASLLDKLPGAPPASAAWDDFVRVYGRPVHRWCRAHGLQPADAADVAQEVLVRFWRQSGRFRYRQGAKFRGYLWVIVRGAVADWHADRRRSTPPDAEPATDPLKKLCSLPARDDLAARIEEAFDTELMALAMQRVRNRVQPRTWRAFQRMVIDLLPGIEVAAELGVEVNVVYVARHKVTRMIRETVHEMESGRIADEL